MCMAAWPTVMLQRMAAHEGTRLDWPVTERARLRFSHDSGSLTPSASLSTDRRVMKSLQAHAMQRSEMQQRPLLLVSAWCKCQAQVRLPSAIVQIPSTCPEDLALLSGAVMIVGAAYQSCFSKTDPNVRQDGQTT